MPLYERLACRPTFDYAVAIFGSGRGAAAVVTGSWGFVCAEAAALAAGLDENAVIPPANHHELQREGRCTWIYPAPSDHRVAIGRLFRVEDFAYHGEDLGLCAALGPRGLPILFFAVPSGRRGLAQAAAMGAAGEGMVEIREFPVRDLRYSVPRDQDGSLRQLGERFAHPALPVPAELEGLFGALPRAV